jgi:hypothetical protein
MLKKEFAEMNKAKFQGVEKEWEKIFGILGIVKTYLDEES